MNYTMDVSDRTRAIRTLLKAYDVKSIQNPDPAFLKKMEKIAAGGGPAEMTMEEYKGYIYDRISQLPVHESNRQDSVSVQISEAGLEKMKADPQYEQWVLDSIKTNFTSRDPWSGMCGGKYVVLFFGDEKGQRRIESWRAGFANGSGNKLFEQKSKNGFWERRVRRGKELAEQYEEMLEVKEQNQDLDKGFYYGDLAVLAAFRPKPVSNVLAQE